MGKPTAQQVWKVIDELRKAAEKKEKSAPRTGNLA